MLESKFDVQMGHYPPPLPLPPGVILLLAAKSGDVAQAQKAIIQMQSNTHTITNSNLNLLPFDDPTTDARGYNSLHLAAMHGHAHIIPLLLNPLVASGVRDRNAVAPTTECTTPGDRLTPLRLAAERGHLEAVRVLLKYGASVTARDGLDQATPLHAAAEAGHTEVAIELVHHGAELEARAVSGQTPLRWALSLGRIEVAAVLLRFGADPDAPDRFGASCLHGVAALQQQQQGEQLLDDELSTFVIDDCTVSADAGSDEVSSLGDVQGVYRCRGRGLGGDGSTGSMPDGNSRSSSCKDSDAHLESESNSQPLAREPKAGATLTAASDHGFTAPRGSDDLFSSSSTAAVAALSGSRFPSALNGTTTCTEYGDGPIRIGTERRKLNNAPQALAELLLTFGARPDFVKSPPPSRSGDSCNSDSNNISFAVGHNAEHPGDIAWQQVATSSIRGGSRSCINERVAGETPLHVAARESSVRVVEALLRAGADPNAKTSPEEGGLTPLHFAAGPGGEEHRRAVVRLLLSAGADADSESGDGVTTPLRRACENAAVGCVEELLRWDPHACAAAASTTSTATTSRPMLSPPGSSYRPCSCCPVPAAASSSLFTAMPPSNSESHSGSYRGFSQNPISFAAATGSSAAAEHISSSHQTGHVPDSLAQRPPAIIHKSTGEFRRLVKVLESEVGSRVPAAARDPSDLESIRIMLRRAPADRAWRRRGWLLMLYTRCLRNINHSDEIQEPETVTFCRSAVGWVSFARSSCRSAVKVVAPSKERVQGEDQQRTQFQASSWRVRPSLVATDSSSLSSSSCRSRHAFAAPPLTVGYSASLSSCSSHKRQRQQHQSSSTCGKSPSAYKQQSSPEPWQKFSSKMTADGACCGSVRSSNSSSFGVAEKKQRATAIGLGRIQSTTGGIQNNDHFNTETTGVVTLRPIVDGLFKIQGDQSIFRQVVQWL